MIRKSYIILFFSFVQLITINGQENYLMFLNDESDAAFGRMKILESAKKELFISYFIFNDDAAGLIAMDLLLQKKEQYPNIDIKLLLDAQGNEVDKSLLYYLEQKGIEVRVFHPLPKLFVPLNKISIKNFFTSWNDLNYRMHDKLIVADGNEIITGGRNIENTYFNLAEKNFHDRDCYFRSEKLAKEVREYFLTIWNSKHVKPLTYNKYYKKGKHHNKNINKLKNIRKYLNQNKSKYQKISSRYDLVKFGLPFKKVIFLNSFNKLTKQFEPEYLSTSLFNLSLKIKKSLLIETPYLVPTKRLYKLLTYLNNNKIKMEFLTNSICSSDAIPVVAAYDSEKKELFKRNIILYEYKGPKYLHAKSAVFDDNISLIGTYNMDPRSAYINTELVFIIDDENIADKLKSLILEDRKNSVKVEKTSDNNPGGYYDCDKKEETMMGYILFKLLALFPFLYYQV
ncbi:MAG TPA: phosphatidylserine/phosphatidylglycerophosphate/cardiolipin synthase family protein [Bacteroidetes bacterium]|nr:phosphatidylserine/phosphatidylglycerophosphate/cardiolipin synthase family protein [Bacteroidota bacterium]